MNPPAESVALGEAVAASSSPAVEEQLHLGREIREGVFWNIGGQVAGRAVSLVFLVILARLLTPRDYGLFALANIVMGFVAIFGNAGLGAAFIHRQGDERATASAAFFLNLLVVGVLAAIVFALAPRVAAFYHEPVVGGLLRVLSVAFFVRAAVAIHEAFLRKQLQFRRLQLITFASGVVYGVLAVLLAWRGWGAWSFAVGFLGSSSLLAVLLWWTSGMPLSPRLYPDRWKHLLRYGGTIFLAAPIWYVVLQGDSFVVGKWIGAAALGAYAIASNYGRLPQMLIGSSVGDVMFSALSRVQNEPERLRELFLKSVRMIALVAFPLAAILYLTADVLVLTLLGERWSAAILPFKILAPVFTALLFAAPFPSLYQAVGRPDLILRLGLATVPVFAGALLVGVRFGVGGTALAVAIVMTLLAFLQLPILASFLRTGLGTLVEGLAPSAVGTLVGLTFVFLTATVWGGQDARSRSLLLACAFAAAYAAVQLGFFRPAWREARRWTADLLRFR